MRFEYDISTGEEKAIVIKKEIERFLQVKSLLGIAARNLSHDDSDSEDYADAAVTLQKFCERFGPQYLDEKGNLIVSPKQAAVDESIPDLP
jgi:hypothetical protein